MWLRCLKGGPPGPQPVGLGIEHSQKGAGPPSEPAPQSCYLASLSRASTVPRLGMESPPGSPPARHGSSPSSSRPAPYSSRIVRPARLRGLFVPCYQRSHLLGVRTADLLRFDLVPPIQSPASSSASFRQSRARFRVASFLPVGRWAKVNPFVELCHVAAVVDAERPGSLAAHLTPFGRLGMGTPG